MADKKDEKNDVPAKDEAVAKQEEQQQKPPGKTEGKSYLQYIIVVVISLIFAAMGFGLGRLFGWTKDIDVNQKQTFTPQEKQATEQMLKGDGSTKDSQGTWYYDIEPVVANLNEPSATRYIRVTLTLQISTELDQKKATSFLEEKKPLLINWLTIYLANQAIDDIRGDRNLRRIQLEITDAFNEKLFPDSKPKIKNVLFKEFAVQ